MFGCKWVSTWRFLVIFSLLESWGFKGFNCLRVWISECQKLGLKIEFLIIFRQIAVQFHRVFSLFENRSVVEFNHAKS